MTGPFVLGLSGQQQLLADQVVLACGDPPPSELVCASTIAGHPGYQADPHCDDALPARCDRLLLIGTGLTMADVAVAAAVQNPRIEIDAISRHGLLPGVQAAPAPHGTGSAAPDRDFLSYLAEGPVSACGLSRAFRELLRDLSRAGGDWRDAVNAARPPAPALWHRLAALERARFLRHLRVYWDVHRHRMPPEIGERLQALRRAAVAIDQGA